MADGDTKEGHLEPDRDGMQHIARDDDHRVRTSSQVSTRTQMALFHCMVRYGSARLGTVRLSSGRFAFPPQFSTAIEWVGLFTRRYNCAASTAVTSS